MSTAITIHPRLKACFERYPALSCCESDMMAAYLRLTDVYSQGKKMLLCGNGGSACDTDHIAGELLKGFGSKRPLDPHWQQSLGDELFHGLQGALPALPLPVFGGLLTAFCNDCNPEHMYAQLVWGLGQAGDALICISTSGHAKNVIHAARVAQAKKMVNIGFTGQSGGALLPYMDVCIRVPSQYTPDIQEYHLPLYHALCLMLEDHFFPLNQS